MDLSLIKILILGLLFNLVGYWGIRKLLFKTPNLNAPLLFLLQILSFILIYEVFSKVILYFHEPKKLGLAWGIYIYLCFLIYAVSVCISSLIVAFLDRKISLIILIFTVSAVSIKPFAAISERPYRMMLIIFCAVFSILFSYFLIEKLCSKDTLY